MSTTTKTDVDKQREEVRELQQDLQRKRLENLPNEHESTAVASDAKGENDKEIEITAFGGYVYLNTHGVAKVDREQLIVLRKQLDRAFQVV